MLRDQKIILRPVEPSDAAHLYRWRNDPDVASRFVGFQAGATMADMEEWVEVCRKDRRAMTRIVWTIVLIENNAPIGYVGLYEIDFLNRNGLFGIAIGEKDQWNKGHGETATLMVLEYAFDQLNLHRVYLEVIETNEAAVTLYKKCGMQEEGRLRNAIFRDGCWKDVIMMSILAPEYKKRNDNG